MRRLSALLLVAMLAAGCGGGTTAPVPATPAPVPTVEPAVAEDTPAPEPAITLPKSYATLNARDWQKLVKAPDKYTGKGYHVWVCITQFDAATGEDSFRGDASYKKLSDWFLDGDNAFFTGDAAKLADLVQDDVVFMNAVMTGSYSYDTQAGGNTTVPLFYVVKASRKGSC